MLALDFLQLSLVDPEDMTDYLGQFLLHDAVELIVHLVDF